MRDIVTQEVSEATGVSAENFSKTSWSNLEFALARKIWISCLLTSIPEQNRNTVGRFLNIHRDSVGYSIRELTSRRELDETLDDMIDALEERISDRFVALYGV